MISCSVDYGKYTPYLSLSHGWHLHNLNSQVERVKAGK